MFEAILAPQRVEAGVTAATGAVAEIAARIFRVEVLMVVLGLDKGRGLADFNSDRLAKLARGVECGLAVLGQFQLVRTVSEDSRTVLIATVAELAAAIDDVCLLYTSPSPRD